MIVHYHLIGHICPAERTLVTALERRAVVVFVAALWCASVAIGRAELVRPLRILTSFYPTYVTTLNIVGDTVGVDVECLMPPTIGCLHDYQLPLGATVAVHGPHECR